MNLRASKTATAAAKDTRSAPMDLDRRRLLKAAIAVPILPAIAGCSTLERGAAVPDALADRGPVLAIQNAGYWPVPQAPARARGGGGPMPGGAGCPCSAFRTRDTGPVRKARRWPGRRSRRKRGNGNTPRAAAPDDSRLLISWRYQGVPIMALLARVCCAVGTMP